MVEDIPVVDEFRTCYWRKFWGVRKIDFTFELVPGTGLISKSSVPHGPSRVEGAENKITRPSR